MRVVLIHGSVGNARVWAPVLPLLEARHEVLTPTRGGYPPGPLLEHIDFEQQADELAPFLGEGAHLAGHSYGAVISLLIAARHPERVRSLVVSEPPAFALARGNRDVDALVDGLAEHFAHGPREPRAYVEGFLLQIGSATRLPDRLPPDLEQGVRAAMVERPPWEAQIPLEELAAADFPKLVVSGGHSKAFEAVCDVLEERLPARREVLTGAGHSIQGAPGYAELLAGFIDDSGYAEPSPQ